MSTLLVPATQDPVEAAREAGLRYVHDNQPGIRRMGSGDRLHYVLPDGRRVSDAATLERIAKLVIPPAWTHVWVCRDSEGHLQATGRDARGRKQYQYHERWRAIRDETKFHRTIAFAESLPKIRARCERDLSVPALPREKVLAAVIRLLESTYIRVGNEEYARSNHHYGLTTLRSRHVQINGETLRFRFRGKSGVDHEVALHDRRLAKVVHGCQELHGQELFEYVGDTGELHRVDSTDVNAYIQEHMGDGFTAKDFRTWAGTVLAVLALEACAGERECVDKLTKSRRVRMLKKDIVEAVKRVAAHLGNRPAVCRKYYIHPAVLGAYEAGELNLSLTAKIARHNHHAARGARLYPEEVAVLKFLRASDRKGINRRPARSASGRR